MLISDDYLVLAKKLHEQGDFGKSGHRWSLMAEQLINNYDIKTLLDYGAGQQTLEKALKGANIPSSLVVRSYDPAIQSLAESPSPADLVTCTDVLEHIEPIFLEEVLNHLSALTLRFVFLVIPTGPAGKFLADGRNAHLIQKPLEWWFPLLARRFNILSINNMTDDIVVFACKKTETRSSINEFLEIEISTLLKSNRVLSVYFDGLALNIFIKPLSVRNRLLPRFLSLLRLGKRVGISERVKRDGTPVRVHLVRH